MRHPFTSARWKQCDSWPRWGASGRIRRPLAVGLGLVLVAGLMAAVAGPSAPAQADPVPPDCAISPFGNSATWGGRDTVFIDGTQSGRFWSRRNLRLGANNASLSAAVLPGAPDSRPMLATASVAADIDGDGTKEIVRAAVPEAAGAATELTPFRTDLSTSTQSAGPTLTLPRYTDIALAAGRFYATPDTMAPTQQVALIGRLPSGGVETRVYRGGSEMHLLEGYPGSWGLQSTPLVKVQHAAGSFAFDARFELVDAVFADIDGDGMQDLVIAYTSNKTGGIRIGTIGGGPPTGSGYNEKPLALNPGGSDTALGFSPRHLRLAAGDFNGDFIDEVAIGWDDVNYLTLPDELYVRTIDFKPTYGYWKTTLKRDFTDQVLGDDQVAPTWDLAVGDVDKDRAAELLVAQMPGQDKVRVTALVGDSPGLITRTAWTTTSVGTAGTFANPRFLAMGTGDQTKDGRADVAIAYVGRDGKMRTHVLGMAPNTTTLSQRATRTEAAGDQPRDVMVADWDNSSVRTVYAEPPSGPRCVDFELPLLMSAVDASPRWLKLQDPNSDPWIGIGGPHDPDYNNNDTFGASAEVMVDGSAAPYPGLAGPVGLRSDSTTDVVADYHYQNGTPRAPTQLTGRTGDWAWQSKGPDTAVGYVDVRYRCYYYRVYDGGPQNAYQALCALTDEVSIPNVTDHGVWDLDNRPEAGDGKGRAWVPVSQEWTNLLLQRTSSDVSVSSTAAGSPAGAPALAIDGDPDAASPATAWRSALQANPYWQVDLGSSTYFKAVVLHPQGPSCSGACLTDPAFPRDLKVFVFDDPALLSVQDPAVMAAQSNVVTFSWDGPAFGPISLSTRGPRPNDPNPLLHQLDPIRGRYVRVQRVGTGQLRLAEVQVYPAQEYVDPVHYPESVRPIAGNDDYFEARVWVDATKSFRWVKVSGRLLYAGGDELVRTGYGDWAVNQEEITSTGVTGTTSLPLEAGGAFATGLSLFESVLSSGAAVAPPRQDLVRSLTLGPKFRIFGVAPRLATFDIHRDEPDWDPSRQRPYLAPERCAVDYRPFYYLAKQPSAWGVTQTYVKVSHLVPEDGLDRSLDLSNCYDGIRRARGLNYPPRLAAFSATASVGQPATIEVLSRATDPNNGDITEILRLAGVAPTASATMAASAATAQGGSVTISGGSVAYTPAPGFGGVDSFYVWVTDGELVSAPALVDVTVS